MRSFHRRTFLLAGTALLLLSTPALGQLPAPPAGDTTFTAPGTTTPATLTNVVGRFPNARDNFGAYGDATATHMLVTTTTGGASATIDFATSGNWPAPAFVAGDIGKPIYIAGAGVAAASLATTITSVNSTSEIVVALGASTVISAVDKAVLYGHDDLNALQAAFTRSASVPVSIPCGTYRFSAPLTVPALGIVIGESIGNPYYYYPGTATTQGPPCVLLMADGFSSSWGVSAGAIMFGGHNGHLENIGVDVHNVAATSSTLSGIYGADQFIEVIHDYVYGGFFNINEAFSAGGTLGWTMRDNDFSQSVSDCIRMSNATDNHIIYNWAHGCGAHALNSNSSAINVIVANTFENATGCGIQFFGTAKSNTVTGNKIENNFACGIEVNAATGAFSVVGNGFYGNGNATTGANWLFNGTSTSVISASGNDYDTTGGTKYQGYVNNAAAMSPLASFAEYWPAQATARFGGAVSTIAASTLLLPLIATPNQLSGPFSNAGTPLPTCTAALNGFSYAVSDATAPTFGANYVFGGAVYSRVMCSATGNWITQ